MAGVVCMCAVDDSFCDKLAATGDIQLSKMQITKIREARHVNLIRDNEFLSMFLTTCQLTNANYNEAVKHVNIQK